MYDAAERSVSERRSLFYFYVTAYPGFPLLFGPHAIIKP
jgi:hypothetical protein